MSLLELWEGDAVEAWAARWRVPRLEIHDILASTNDRARELAGAGAEAFTTVLAEEQTAGRGREGRRWTSPAGSGLWMSVIAGGLDGDARALVPLRTGLAACRAVERAAPGVPARLKWPNDVLLHGRKVCGILCEASPAGVVIGIGVNVRPALLPPEVAARAIALEEAAGAEVDRAALAEALLGELRELVGPGPLAPDLARELAARDALRGRPVVAGTGERGVARGVDSDGALLVEVGPGDLRRVVAGGVRLADV